MKNYTTRISAVVELEESKTYYKDRHMMHAVPNITTGEINGSDVEVRFGQDSSFSTVKDTAVMDYLNYNGGYSDTP